MPWRAAIDTDTALAAILGVSRPAIVKAERRGKISRDVDGTWDVFAVVAGWRHSTLSSLQRQGSVFRPWLDPSIPLRASIWCELVRRARAGGAFVFWEDEEAER
jgi:hypothetical protein